MKNLTLKIKTWLWRRKFRREVLRHLGNPPPGGWEEDCLRIYGVRTPPAKALQNELVHQ